MIPSLGRTLTGGRPPLGLLCAFSIATSPLITRGLKYLRGMKEVGSDFGAGGVEIGVEHSLGFKRSVTGGSDGPPHCKNTRAAVCNIDPDQLARLALLPLSDGCRGSDGAGKTKILKSNDVDKQKASNSVGHRRTICQGMLRRKTELNSPIPPWCRQKPSALS